MSFSAENSFSNLKNVTSEKDVEIFWRDLIISELREIEGNDVDFGNGFISNIAGVYTDGYLKVTANNLSGGLFGDKEKQYSILLEAKKGLKFSGHKGINDRAKVVAQCLYYLKHIEKNAQDFLLPNVVIIADEDEVFFVKTADIDHLLEKVWLSDPDWSFAPSEAYKNTELMNALKETVAITTTIVHSVFDDRNKPFNYKLFIKRISETCHNNTRKLSKFKVDAKSLMKSFTHFNRDVFGGYQAKGSSTTQMSVFVKSIFNDSNAYVHPKRHNTFIIESTDSKGRLIQTVIDGKRHHFNTDAYEKFRNEYDFDGNYSEQEKKNITEICDQLLENTDRRFTGDFWTPVVWVNEMHKLITKHLGEDWKEKYIVWDSSCGSKNITRDYVFGENKDNANLYLSTLHQEELDISEDYNVGATCFQYDFLNDDAELGAEFMQKLYEETKERTKAEKAAERKTKALAEKALLNYPDETVETIIAKGLVEKVKPDYSGTFDGFSAVELAKNIPADKWKLPESLVQALKENKPFVMIGNPPYGANAGDKAGIAKTKTNEIMRKLKVGGNAANELYTQFIYRTIMLARIFGYTENFFFFFFFFNKGFLTLPSFGAFTDDLTSDFKFLDGFMINAGEFNGTSSAWGVICSGWEIDVTENHVPQKEFHFDVMKSVTDNYGNVMASFVDNWKAYKVSNNALSGLNCKPFGRYLEAFPTTNNGFDTGNGLLGAKYTDMSFGFTRVNSNTIQESDKNSFMLSLAYRDGKGFAIAPNNFAKSAVVFSIRKSWLDIIKREKKAWIRDKDIFTKPTDDFFTDPNYPIFETDCVVYSLFAAGSNQTSLRDYDCDGKTYNIINEFFPYSIDKVRQELTKDPQTNRWLLDDLRKFSKEERFVYKWLKEAEENGHISADAQEMLDLFWGILSKSFKYREKFDALPGNPKFNLLTWDAGFNQINRLCFTRTALMDAKIDIELQNLWDEFKAVRKRLGDSIAYRYSANTGF